MTRRSKLVSYYPSKDSVILDHGSDVLENVPLELKQKIHAFDKHPTDFSTTYNIAIPNVVKNLKNINLNSNHFDETSTKFYSAGSAIF